jgi:hypothetical protein
MSQARPAKRLRVLLVALIVLSIGAVCSQIRSTEHWDRCQKRAYEHAFMEAEIARYIAGGARIVPAYDDGPPAEARELLRYHAELRQKYRIAAWFPWRTVPPDPPVPALRSPR